MFGECQGQHAAIGTPMIGDVMSDHAEAEMLEMYESEIVLGIHHAGMIWLNQSQAVYKWGYFRKFWLTGSVSQVSALI